MFEKLFKKKDKEPARSPSAEEAGVLLEEKNGQMTARIVRGAERPEMMCKTISGDIVSCRPYKSDLRAKLMEDLIKDVQNDMRERK